MENPSTPSELDSGPTGSTKLVQLLQAMSIEGGFVFSVLTDRDGFPIAAAAGADQATDKQSAVVAFVQRTAAQVRNSLGMAEMNEVTFFDSEGRRLVCRPFEVNGQSMILAVLVPTRDGTYRRAMTRALTAIRQSLKN